MDKEYQVLTITEMMRPSDTEGIVKFYRHRIKTKGGVVLSVDIEERDFTAEKAAPILLKKAQDADAILKF